MNQEQRKDILKKYAKEFAVCPKSNNTLLEGIYYDSKGRGIVTNTHVLLLVDDVASPGTSPVVLHHATGNILEGTYPNVDRIVPEKYSLSIDLFPEVWREIEPKQLKALEKLHKVAEGVATLLDGVPAIMAGVEFYTKVASYEVGGCELMLKVSDSTITFSAILPAVKVREVEFQIGFNPTYVVSALKLIAAFKPKKVTLNFNTALAPMVFTTDVGVTVLVTPIRIP